MFARNEHATGFPYNRPARDGRAEIHGLSTRSPATKSLGFYPRISLRSHHFLILATGKYDVGKKRGDLGKVESNETGR